MRQHYEWAVIGPDGQNLSGIFTSGPQAPREELRHGRWRQEENSWGDPRFDEDGEPIMSQVSPPAPEGSFVGRRLVTEGDWEVADDALTPPPVGVSGREGE